MNFRRVKPQFISVPFKADSANGVTEYNGIAKFSPAGIVFEFDSLTFGLIGGEIKEVKVALDEILDIRFRKGIYKFFAQIQLRLRNFAKLSELPGYGGKVKLKIKREDYALAERAVEEISRYLRDNESVELLSGETENERLPPAQTFVGDLIDTEKLTVEDLRETKKFFQNPS